MAIKRVRTREPRALTTEQKVAFAILVFLGAGGLILGFRSFGVAISRPFDLQIANYLKGEKFLTSTQREEQELEASKTRDVDGDGLMDYDELYVYKTSAYLADSDSDGFDDKTEVFSGNDPNCPQDTDCRQTEAAEAEAKQEVLPGLAGAFGDTGGTFDLSKVDFKSQEDVKAFFQKATFAEIRNALIQAGVEKEKLDQIDDEALQQFFNTTLDNAAEEGTFDSLVKPEEASPNE